MKGLIPSADTICATKLAKMKKTMVVKTERLFLAYCGVPTVN